jgi:mannitol/fructose-specific phosphotransferase system IIA component (Ntr-type)
MKLSDLLETDDIVFGIRGADIADAAAQLLGRTLPRRGYQPADVARIIDAVIAREREAPTLCGTIAIPHARDARCGSFVAAIGINPGGVAGTGSPRVLIAFVSPDARRSEHLALLSSLARLARDQGAVNAISAAADPQTVLDAIRARRE